MKASQKVWTCRYSGCERVADSRVSNSVHYRGVEFCSKHTQQFLKATTLEQNEMIRTLDPSKSTNVSIGSIWSRQITEGPQIT